MSNFLVINYRKKMLIVQLFFLTCSYFNHVLRKKGFKGASSQKFYHLYLKNEKYVEKHCRTKVLQSNVLNNILPIVFLLMTFLRNLRFLQKHSCSDIIRIINNSIKLVEQNMLIFKTPYIWYQKKELIPQIRCQVGNKVFS